jgi:hypothetical protein
MMTGLSKSCASGPTTRRGMARGLTRLSHAAEPRGSRPPHVALPRIADAELPASTVLLDVDPVVSVGALGLRGLRGLPTGSSIRSR